MGSSMHAVEMPDILVRKGIGTGVNQSAIFSLEERFSEDAATQWMKNNWQISVWLSLIYVIFLLIGQHVMKDRPRFELRTWLILWSASLAIFSIMASLRTFPETIHMLQTHGFSATLCDSSHYGTIPVGFWGFLFVLSKVVELGDTAFIVLRKQKLIFLHWWHHATVMIYVW